MCKTLRVKEERSCGTFVMIWIQNKFLTCSRAWSGHLGVHDSTHLGGAHVNTFFHLIPSAAIPADSP